MVLKKSLVDFFSVGLLGATRRNPHKSFVLLQLGFGRRRRVALAGFMFRDLSESLLDRQSLAALGAPSFEHQAPVLGAHADQKSVGPLPRDGMWLVGPFQDTSSCRMPRHVLRTRHDLSLM